MYIRMPYEDGLNAVLKTRIMSGEAEQLFLSHPKKKKKKKQKKQQILMRLGGGK